MEATASRISLLKQRVNLTKDSLGLGGQKAQVELVLDISLSIQHRYSDGTIQDLVERLASVAMSFDDDGTMPVTAFGRIAHNSTPVTASNISEYVNRHILAHFNFEGSTIYSLPLSKIIHRHWNVQSLYQKWPLDWLKNRKIKEASCGRPPIFVLFVTDGDNHDKADMEKLLTSCKTHPIFIQFIGIDGSSGNFTFINRMTKQANVGFSHSSDIISMQDSELYDSILSKFADWAKTQKSN